MQKTETVQVLNPDFNTTLKMPILMSGQVLQFKFGTDMTTGDDSLACSCVDLTELVPEPAEPITWCPDSEWAQVRTVPDQNEKVSLNRTLGR